jgi:putative DNA primase/helicase
VKDAVIKLTDNNIVMDDNPFLYAFNNKIYDLQKGCFVEPHYTQYVSFTAGWNWSDYYNPNLVKELEDIITTILPNKEVRDYYLMILATGMYGALIEHLFIAKGCGGNGKSLINELYQSALGKYSYKLPSSVLLNPLKDGGNPEVACASRKRGVIADEPDASKRISSATIKALTGASNLNARKNYSNDVAVKLMLTLILECNSLPKLDEITQAVNRRIRVIPFNGVFIDKEKYDAMTPIERKEKGISGAINPYFKTPEFKEKYRQALVLLMMRQFDRYREKAFNFPK